MGSSDRLFGRQRSVHEILGGGIVADIVLWRRRHITVGILLVTLAAWVVFERSGYTLLSLVANVLLLLVSILFIWAKAAGILNRPLPPIPELHLSEEVINEAAAFICSHVNALLSSSHDIALGKDSVLFYKVAASLWLISFVGGWTNFLTLSYTGLVILLTIPVAYEKYEDHIDKYMIFAFTEVHRVYKRLDKEYFCKIRKWILEKRKLS